MIGRTSSEEENLVGGKIRIGQGNTGPGLFSYLVLVRKIEGRWWSCGSEN